MSLCVRDQEEVIYDVPFEEKKTSYNQKSFSGDRHYLVLRPAKAWEIGDNLAKNVTGLHGQSRGVIPTQAPMWRTRGEAVFAARNAIDGVVANVSHGNWPYESWESTSGRDYPGVRPPR